MTSLHPQPAMGDRTVKAWPVIATGLMAGAWLVAVEIAAVQESPHLPLYVLPAAICAALHGVCIGVYLTRHDVRK